MCPSELVADCFELARDIRALDMRASPYDLSDRRRAATTRSEGKLSCAAAQRGFAGAPLPRAARSMECERLLDVTG